MLDAVQWEEVPPPFHRNVNGIPHVTHKGVLEVGDKKLTCYQLSDGRRVFDAGHVEAFFDGVLPAHDYEVAELTKTCGACPAQWEGKTACGKYIYARYRHGFLSVEVDGQNVLSKEVPKQADGCMDFDELKEHAPMIKWD